MRNPTGIYRIMDNIAAAASYVPSVQCLSTPSSTADWLNKNLKKEEQLPLMCRALYLSIKNFCLINFNFSKLIEELGYTRTELEVAFETSKLEYIQKDFQNDQEKEQMLPFIDRTFTDYLDTLFEYENKEEFPPDLDLIFRHLYIAYLRQNSTIMIGKFFQSIQRSLLEKRFSREDFKDKIEEATYPQFWLIDDADSAQFFCKFAGIINNFIKKASQAFHNSHTRKRV